ncbi:hypothetical protein PhaeoP83_02670 [Phaeobacter inhibens]|uniref:Uncharacterized protein n=1 Tax=Phaeobacter inhibens TaxID=221822 RepID=A0ABM6RIZ0_9RHOB|nr:hypothetical protein [Phaeobacter inhibens]AUQ50920.1 hypothetical protein PhaeoP83_02670 [Phaeobacter inhibens]AUQ96434.1 hypothetical protein PhaeoP66_03704 [Phaeobacter inhibens]AUR20725.1 hypothetical protein PhaeoP80_02670 [Phaeobacter inhibens]
MAKPNDTPPQKMRSATDSSASNHGGMPTLTVDWLAYAPLLEDQNIPDAQKKELIEVTWGFVVGFVDLGFDTRTPDQACEQIADTGIFSTADLLSCLQDQEQQMTSILPVGGQAPQPQNKEAP